MMKVGLTLNSFCGTVLSGYPHLLMCFLQFRVMHLHYSVQGGDSRLATATVQRPTLSTFVQRLVQGRRPSIFYMPRVYSPRFTFRFSLPWLGACFLWAVTRMSIAIISALTYCKPLLAELQGPLKNEQGNGIDKARGANGKANARPPPP